MGVNEPVATSTVRRVQARGGSGPRSSGPPTTRLRDLVTSLVALTIPLVVGAIAVGSLTLVRAGALEPAPATILIGADSQTPDDAKVGAASKLEARRWTDSYLRCTPTKFWQRTSWRCEASIEARNRT